MKKSTLIFDNMSAENVIEILSSLGYKLIRRNAGNYSAQAVYRGGDNPKALSISLSKNCFYDFKTHAKGSIKDLIKLTVGDKVIVEDLVKNVNINYSKVSSNKKPNIEMESSFDLQFLSKLFPLYDFFIKRSIPIEILKEFECGYCMEDKMYQRIVFPIFNQDKNKIIGLAGRSVQENPKMKWKILGGKLNFVYPYHLSINEILNKNGVILVESIGDLLSLYTINVRNVLCLFGTRLSKKLLSVLVGLPVNNICIMTNNDVKLDGSNPGKDNGIKIGQKLKKFLPESNIKLVLPPTKFNDLNNFLQQDPSGFSDWINKKIWF